MAIWEMEMTGKFAILCVLLICGPSHAYASEGFADFLVDLSSLNDMQYEEAVFVSADKYQESFALADNENKRLVTILDGYPFTQEGVTHLCDDLEKIISTDDAYKSNLFAPLTRQGYMRTLQLANENDKSIKKILIALSIERSIKMLVEKVQKIPRGIARVRAIHAIEGCVWLIANQLKSEDIPKILVWLFPLSKINVSTSEESIISKIFFDLAWITSQEKN